MQALVLNKAGERPDMAIEDREVPQWRPGYSLIRVHAATVNPLSNWIRTGAMREGVSVPLVLSNDGSGVVEQSDEFSKGSAVLIYGGGQLGLSEDGLQQQWALVENTRLTVVPETLSLDAAAALPVNYVTANQAMRRVGNVQSGQTVIISGASGSVGHALIQLARVLGARPIGVVSHADKVQPALDSGAEVVIDTSTQDLAQAALELTHGQGAEWAFDVLGGSRVEHLLSSVCVRGTVVCIGFSASTHGSLNVADLVISEKRLLGYDAHLETDADVQQTLKELIELAATGAISPRIDSSYALSDFDEAYERLSSRKACGTVLLHLN